jgi:hypothetical protein
MFKSFFWGGGSMTAQPSLISSWCLFFSFSSFSLLFTCLLLHLILLIQYNNNYSSFFFLQISSSFFIYLYSLRDTFRSSFERTSISQFYFSSLYILPSFNSIVPYNHSNLCQLLACRVLILIYFLFIQ